MFKLRHSKWELIVIQFMILIFIQLFNIPFIECDQNEDINASNDNSDDTIVLYQKYKVLLIRNSKDLTKSLCTISWYTSSSNKSIVNDEYQPFNYYQSKFNLCLPLSTSTDIRFARGYHTFNYQNSCNINEQIKKFISSFNTTSDSDSDKPSGILFATPCNVNVTANFNLTNTVKQLIDRHRLSITVINLNKKINLQKLHEFTRIRWPAYGHQPYNHDSSLKFLSLIPMIVIFLIATTTILIGAYWSGLVRFRIYEYSKILPLINSDTNSNGKYQIKSKRSSESAGKNDNNSLNNNSNNIKSTFNKHHEKAFTNISIFSVVILVFSMITALLLLYFFYGYLVYFILTLFLLTSMTSMFICLDSFIEHVCPKFIYDSKFRIPKMLCMNKEQSIRYIVILIILTSIAIPITWFIVRHEYEQAWILQNLLGFFFCINMLRTLRLPSLRICTYLLSILFLYDIFFVFITPMITSKGQSIMVEVATGGNGLSPTMNYDEYRCEGRPIETLPMLFRVPQKLFQYDPLNFYDVCTRGSDSMLGYGDVMIPGLLIAYCSAFDRIENVSYHLYFVVSFVSYCIGLIITFAALILMEGAAQPALLYLVPFTLIPLFIVSLILKNFQSLWKGPEKIRMRSMNEIMDNDQSSQPHQQQQQPAIPSSSSASTTTSIDN